MSTVLIWQSQSNVISEYVDLSHLNKSVATFCHGRLGNSVEIKGSAFCDLNLPHLGQSFTSFSCCSDNPSHHTACLALSLHFLIPWWPTWILSRISLCRDAGMTNWFPRSSKPFWTDSSVAIRCGTSLMPGHPFLQYSTICWHTSSSFCFLFISSRRFSVARRLCKVDWMYASASSCSNLSCEVEAELGALENASVIVKFFPGTWLIWKLKRIIRILNRYTLIGSSSRSFALKRGTNGLWSVSMLKCRPTSNPSSVYMPLSQSEHIWFQLMSSIVTCMSQVFSLH